MEEYDLEEDLRGYCERRNCLYNEEGRCAMRDGISMPDDVDNCDNFEYFEE